MYRRSRCISESAICVEVPEGCRSSRCVSEFTMCVGVHEGCRSLRGVSEFTRWVGVHDVCRSSRVASEFTNGVGVMRCVGVHEGCRSSRMVSEFTNGVGVTRCVGVHKLCWSSWSHLFFWLGSCSSTFLLLKLIIQYEYYFILRYSPSPSLILIQIWSKLVNFESRDWIPIIWQQATHNSIWISHLKGLSRLWNFFSPD